MRTYLLRLRESAGFTKKEMSVKLGISESYYNLIEKGERQTPLNINVLNRLSEILNISMDELAKDELAYYNAKK